MATLKTANSVTAPGGVHAYTFAELKLAVQNAIAMSPDPATTSAEQIVNDALANLTVLHEWSWRRRPLTLESTAGQEFITLPADFASLKSLHVGTCSRACDIDAILTLRSRSLDMGQELTHYAVTLAPQTAASALPVYRLELFPTPSATTTTGYARGVYLRRLPLLVNNTDYPDLPALFHPLLAQLCRARAVSDQEQVESEEWRVFNNLLPAYVAEDGRMMGDLGLMRGAVGRRAHVEAPAVIGI